MTTYMLPLYHPFQTEDWHVYIIQSERDGSFYVGVSTDPQRRLRAHNSGHGAKRTRGRGPWVLRASKACGSKSAALKEECWLKRLSHAEKSACCQEIGVSTVYRSRETSSQ